jgi:N6-adenosine-specific RNA methylase IME4
MKKYSIIYADPPWSYGSKYGADMKKISEQYPVMTVKEIKNLPVKNIINDTALLFLWCTDSHLPEGLEVIKAWGFKYKTVAFNWIKKTNTGTTCVNVAPYTLKSWELCLLATRGTPTKELLINRNVRGLVEAERTVHSKKPEEVRVRIEKMVGNSRNIDKIELFARESSPGWDVWGNEVDSDIFLG